MRKVNYSTFFFLLTTIILGALFIVNKANNARDKRYDTSTVLSKIVHIQELATIKYNYAGVIGYKDVMKILNINVPLTEKYFLLKYNGYLKAGVDFSRIVVDINGETVHVSMPRAQVFDMVIDENSVKVYDESDNAFNPIKISDYNNALAKEKETMRRDAVRQGVLKDAEGQAELAVKSLLREMGFKNIDIALEIVIPEVH